MRLSLWRAASAAALVLDVAACGAATGIPGDAPATSDGGVSAADVSMRGDASGGPPVHDAGGRDAARVDATARDAMSVPHDAAADTTATRDALVDTLMPGDSAGDGALPLSPDEVVAGHGLTLFGVTDHGLIIYADAAGTCWALAFGGGTPEVISPPSFMADAGGARPDVGIRHDVVFMSVFIAAPATAPLFAWSSTSGGPHSLPNLMGFKGSPLSAASVDSRYVAYSWDEDFGQPWYVARVDGSDALYLGYGTVQFDGSKAVLGLGNISPDSSPLAAFDGANGWASVPLSADPRTFALDALGENVLSYGPGGKGLLLSPLDGGVPTLVDPNAVFSSALYLSPDSSLALYTTASGAQGSQLEAVSLPGGSPYAVEPGAVSDVDTIVDVALDSPFGPIAVVSGENGEVVLGVAPGASAPDRGLAGFNALTADGSYALFIDGTELGAIDLAGSPTDAPSVLTTTLPLIWPRSSALTGTRVLFCDNDLTPEQSGGVTDIRAIDVAAGATSRLVVAAVDIPPGQYPLYALSPDTTLVAYVRNTGASTDGLYVTSVP